MLYLVSEYAPNGEIFGEGSMRNIITPNSPQIQSTSPGTVACQKHWQEENSGRWLRLLNTAMLGRFGKIDFCD